MQRLVTNSISLLITLLNNFQFENQLKLDYTGNSDQIINVSRWQCFLPAKRNVDEPHFVCVKTELQFGKLYITTVLANQNSSQATNADVGSGSRCSSFRCKGRWVWRKQAPLLRNISVRILIKTWRTCWRLLLRSRFWDWVRPNCTGSTTENRNVAFSFMDLGETNHTIPISFH